jgi:hypothetical protein
MHIQKVFVELKGRKQVENLAVFVELKRKKQDCLQVFYRYRMKLHFLVILLAIYTRKKIILNNHQKA